MKAGILLGVAIIALIIGFGAGIFATPYVFPISEMPGSDGGQEATPAGFVPVNISIDGNSVFLTSECQALTFEVTDDQAFSIAHGIEGTVAIRPLTHDIFRDVLDGFVIGVSQLKIDRYEDDIYKAHVTLSQGDHVLDVDIRPSDAIALATRMGRTLFVNQGILETQGVSVC